MMMRTTAAKATTMMGPVKAFMNDSIRTIMVISSKNTIMPIHSGKNIRLQKYPGKRVVVVRVRGIWVGSEPYRTTTLTLGHFGWRDDVFCRGVEIISKALWNEYDELTWQDWMKLRYKITPNPNLNDLDDTRRRETLKHLLPSPDGTMKSEPIWLPKSITNFQIAILC